MREYCQLKKKKAFGLLEVLLSGVIIIIILSALTVVARNAVDNSVLLQQRAQATYLAQEGIELVRQIRDTNYIDGNPDTKWNTLVGSDSTDSSFTAMKNYYIPNHLIADRQRALLYLSGQESLTNITIDGTNFERGIVITNLNQGASTSDFLPRISLNGAFPSIGKLGCKVMVTVRWKSKNSDKSIVLETRLTNSRQGF
ncbi:MAG: hypothetical protein BWY19_01112 [bacterium ADurb.Bin212]|nr:MAG: hypothetical protein BWY19_01112 [bacterium ADurb.Bin212]